MCTVIFPSRHSVCFPRGFQALCSHLCDRKKHSYFCCSWEPSRLCWNQDPPSSCPDSRFFSVWSDLRGTSLELLFSCFLQAGTPSLEKIPSRAALLQGLNSSSCPSEQESFPFKMESASNSFKAAPRHRVMVQDSEYGTEFPPRFMEISLSTTP